MDSNGMQKDANPAQITVKDFQYVQGLGQGGFGKVVLMKHSRQDGQKLVALKQQPKDKDLKRRSMLELRILRDVKNGPFCLQMLASFQTGSFLYQVTEYYSGGCLHNHIRLGTHFSGPQFAVLAAEIAEALFFLHRNVIIHRDVKPSNIMFDAKGHCRLIDFGGALYDDCAEDNKKHLRSGTPAYWAPELFRKPPIYDQTVDWWALGVSLLELVHKHNPLDVDFNCRDKEYLQLLELKIKGFKMDRGLAGFKYGVFSRSIKKFIGDLLIQDTGKRLGSLETDVRNHTVFKTRGILKNPDMWLTLHNGQMRPPLRVPKRGDLKEGADWNMGVQLHPDDGQNLPADHYQDYDTAFTRDEQERLHTDNQETAQQEKSEQEHPDDEHGNSNKRRRRTRKTAQGMKK